MYKFFFFNLIAILLYGCTATHLVYVNDTSMGLDVAVSTEGTGRVVFGYDRGTYAIIPRKEEGKDAMSLTSIGCIYAQGLGDVSFNHFVSSGDAAKRIAKSEKGLEKINNAIYGGGEKCQ